MHLNRIRSLLPSFTLERTSKAADEESIKCSTIRGHSHSGFPSSILSARPETTVGKRILFSPSHPISRRRRKFIIQQLDHIPSLVLLNQLWTQAWRADQWKLLRNTSRPLNSNEPTTRVNYLLQSYTFPRALLVTLLPNPFFVPLYPLLVWSSFTARVIPFISRMHPGPSIRQCGSGSKRSLHDQQK